MMITRKIYSFAIHFIYFCVLPLGSLFSQVRAAVPFLGFTPFPYALSQSDSVQKFTYDRIALDGNIIAHHFDDGIPWNEAFADSLFPSSIVSDWNTRIAHTPVQHKVYVAITPINILRNGLALNKNNNGGDQPLPPPWDTLPFHAPQVKKAFLNYCKRIIDTFHPEYIAIGIEVNLLKKETPALWASYVELHSYIYVELKKKYPMLPIFVSCTGFDLAGFTSANQSEQVKALHDIIPWSDYFGLSLHPQLSVFMAEVVPSQQILDSICLLSQKPIAICETSYPAEYFTVYNNSLIYNGTAQKQHQYISNLISLSQQREIIFIINFILRDYDQLWSEIGSPDDINKIWKDTGFYTENGEPREVLQLWKKYILNVEQERNNVPQRVTLHQNYPNPFNPSTVISYQVPENSYVLLKVYDAIGKEVETMVDEVKEAGNYSVQFNGKTLSSGMYFARLQSGDKVQLRKMMLVK
ncbi:MAG: T9SS type A sorting domain-containing protein [Bacteriovoracaceae bacterium]|nr:T9SS type A sorting domain-containing protein [Bacteroidota bacterium]